MDVDYFYPEFTFIDSLTFGKWVPLMCSDLSTLFTFFEIYNRQPDPSVCVQNNVKTSFPFFFRNHPINYVFLTGKILNPIENAFRPAKNSRNSKKQPSTLAISFYLDDNSGEYASCVIYTHSGVYDIDAMKDNVYQVYGYITQHSIFGRQVRVTQVSRIQPGSQEIRAWKETMKVRQEVLCKHWNHFKEGDHQDLTRYKKEQALTTEKDFYNSIINPSLQRILFCSFDRPNSLFTENPNSIQSTEKEVRLSKQLCISKYLSRSRVESIRSFANRSAIVLSAPKMSKKMGKYKDDTIEDLTSIFTATTTNNDDKPAQGTTIVDSIVTPPSTPKKRVLTPSKKHKIFPKLEYLNNSTKHQFPKLTQKISLRDIGEVPDELVKAVKHNPVIPKLTRKQPAKNHRLNSEETMIEPTCYPVNSSEQNLNNVVIGSQEYTDKEYRFYRLRCKEWENTQNKRALSIKKLSQDYKVKKS